MKAVIILPTYNELENIRELVPALEEKIFPRIKNWEISILVADDFSPDKTTDLVRDFQKKYKNLYLVEGEKKGLGAAYLRAMKYASDKLETDVFIQMDADLSHDPDEIPNFLKAVEDNADFVVGTRYIKGGSIPRNWPAHRKVFSVFGNLIVRYGLGILHLHDWSSGYRAMKKWVFFKSRKGLAGYNGYVFQIAFLDNALKHGANIKEIPINFTDRKLGKSKFPAKEYIINVLAYVVKGRIERMIKGSFLKFVTVGFIGFVLQTLIAKFLITRRISPAGAVSAGAEAAIINNFLFNNFWTFSHKRHTEINTLLKKFIHFNGVSLGAIAIQGISVALGTKIFGPSSWFVIMVLSIAFLVIPYSYFIYNRLIWKKR